MSITLAAPHVAQAAVSSSSVVVLQNEDRPVDRKLRSLVELGGNASYHYWIPVYDGDDYNAEWTDADVAAAVVAWFLENP